MVRFVDFSNNQLSGTLDAAAFCTLPALAALGCDGMHLSGTIPACIGMLTRLTFFSAARNYIQGSIPKSLNSLTALQSEFSYVDNLCLGN